MTVNVLLTSAILFAAGPAILSAAGPPHQQDKPFFATHRTANYDPATGQVAAREDIVFARRADGSTSQSRKDPTDVIGFRVLQLAEHGFRPLTVDPLVDVVYRGGLTKEQAETLKAQMAASGKPLQPQSPSGERAPLPPCEEFFDGAVCTPAEPVFGQRAFRVNQTIPGRGDDVIREESIVLADYAFYPVRKRSWLNGVLVFEQSTESFIIGDPPGYLFAIPENVPQTADEREFMWRQAKARGHDDLAARIRQEQAQTRGQSARFP